MAPQDYHSLTVVQIRELFKSRGIPATGLTRKQQLIDRLLEVDASAETDPQEKPSDAPAEPAIDAQEEQEAAQQVNAAETVVRQPPEEQAQQPPEEAASKEAVPVDEPAQQTQDEPLAVEKEELAQAGVNDDTTTNAPANGDVPMVDATPEKPSDRGSVAPTPEQPEHPDASEQPSDDSRKRKRRSATPPVDAQEVAKKRARQADGDSAAPPVRLPEDKDARAAHAVETVQETVKDAAEDAAMQDSKPLVNAADAEPAPAEDDDVRMDAPAALHPETTAIYIRNLKRPIRAPALESHLLSLANLTTTSSLPTFYIDRMKSHAFAVFPTVSHAARARARLHDTIWPDEPQREHLWIDFIPADAVPSYIASEDAAPSARFEVVYDGPQGTATPRHQHAGAGGPTAPSGPAAGAPPSQPRGAALPPAEVRRETDPRFLKLDELFRGTAAKPKVYWLPVERAVAQRRLDELDARLVRRVPGGSGLPDSRRYTFEDGDVMVDGGPEFGMRGDRRRGRGGGGYRGDRGGGGGRGWRY